MTKNKIKAVLERRLNFLLTNINNNYYSNTSLHRTKQEVIALEYVLENINWPEKEIV